jgi:hypothetical protein
MEDENARLKAELSSLQGDNEVLRLQLAAKRSTFVDAEVSSLQEELGRVKGLLNELAELSLWMVKQDGNKFPLGLPMAIKRGIDAAGPRDTSAIGCADEGGK